MSSNFEVYKVNSETMKCEELQAGINYNEKVIRAVIDVTAYVFGITDNLWLEVNTEFDMEMNDDRYTYVNNKKLTMDKALEIQEERITLTKNLFTEELLLKVGTMKLGDLSGYLEEPEDEDEDEFGWIRDYGFKDNDDLERFKNEFRELIKGLKEGYMWFYCE